MAEQEREDRTKVFDKLSGTQKSAILMMLLGEDEASEILKNLTPKEGFEKAKESLNSGKAKVAFEKLVEISKNG